MLTRRDVLRSLSLATLAVTASPLLAACGDNGSSAAEGGSDQAGSTQLQLVSSSLKRTAAPAGAIPAAVGGMHGLGAGLYGAVAKTPGNVAISPFSIAMALGLTVNGAEGDTETEMLKVLGSPDVDTLDTGLNALSSYVDGLAGPIPGSKGMVVLDSANSLFGQAGEHWEKPFLDRLATSFGAGMQTVDWKGASEAARAAVNTWTAQHTDDRIPTILPEGSVDSGTRLVLVNALYFKAPWAEPFETSATTDKPFHLDDGSTANVPMMSSSGKATYLTGEGYDGARLSYAGGRLAMSLLLPAEGGLAALEARVAAGELPAVLTSTGANTVDLLLPRWTFLAPTALKGPLSDLGMPTAFSDHADFTGMTKDDPLQIGDVYHQVFIAVDESGTEAAAATAVSMQTLGLQLPREPVSVTLDRPYLFVIHDTDHLTPLFVGRVSDPRG